MNGGDTGPMVTRDSDADGLDPVWKLFTIIFMILCWITLLYINCRRCHKIYVDAKSDQTTYTTPEELVLQWMKNSDVIKKASAITTQKNQWLVTLVGDNVPSVEMYENDPSVIINLAEEAAKGGKIIVLGVPGAFTPVCTRTHLPGYIKKADEFKKRGFRDIFCVSVNDLFVMAAWSKSLNATGKVRFLADAQASFTKAMGVDEVMPNLGGVRSKRYSIVIDNGIISQVNIEIGNSETTLACSNADSLTLK